MYEIRKDNRIRVKPTIGNTVYVGEVVDGYFRCTDKDNYHAKSDSLGIDKMILYAPDLTYEFITFKFHGKTYITTRKFFSEKAVEHKLLNGRIQLFLPIKEFGLANALKYEKKFSREKLSKLTIFDIKDDSKLLKRWQEELALQEIEEVAKLAKEKESNFKSERVDI